MIFFANTKILIKGESFVLQKKISSKAICRGRNREKQNHLRKSHKSTTVWYLYCVVAFCFSLSLTFFFFVIVVA